jgi:hypothetical protein
VAARARPPDRPGQAGGLLQRKCACGAATASLTGECRECRSIKGLQAKLAIGASNDPLEQEADRVADQVLAAPAHLAVSGASPRIQRFTGQATGQAGTAPASVDHVLAGPGTPLDPGLRQDMEQRFGHDFSRVRVHSGAAAEQSAREVGADAYTAGNRIVFGAGRFAPGTCDGRRLLAHELTHVVQQSASPPGSHSDVVVVRQMDAGVATDAGASRGPRDAGPGAGAPGPGPAPAPAPAAPAPAGPALAATIGAITFRGSANRIAPTRSVSVPVALSGLPAGGSATIDVEGSGGVNGTAVVTAGAALTASGTVTVRGDAQTTVGNAGKLRLRASVGGTVIGRSAGFTVAAWPADFSTSRVSDIDTGGAVGVAAANAWVSDGSALAELDEVERTERVDIGSRDNPPFTSGSGTSATAGTSSFIAGAASPTTDRHSYGRALIDTSTVRSGFHTLVYRQNFLFNDRRTGTTNAVVQNSGFTITHTAMVLDFPIGGRRSTHLTVKRGAAVTVEGKATTAGSGTATSDTHTL